MKSLLKRIYRRSIGPLVGYGVINYHNAGKINFIDVGSIGDLPSPWFENSKYIRNILKFEPQDSKGTKKNEITVDVALWKENCQRRFYIFKGMKSHGASLFEQNFEYVNANFEALRQKGPKRLAETWHDRSSLVKTDTVTCRTLDSVIADLKLPFIFDFLKIDAQGAEFEILQGADKLLRNDCIGLQLELFNIPLYKEIRLDTEVIHLVEKYGLKQVKKMPYHGSFDSQNDYIFFKEDVPEDKKDLISLLKTIYGI